MAGPSKFKFPIPHRRSRQPTNLEVQTISSPMTNKAHKLLGTAELNIDPSPTSSTNESSRFWETRSAVSGVSGISVTISETTASGTVTRTRSPLSTLDEGTVATSSRGYGKVAWDQESDIIPKGLGFNGSSAGRTQNMDTVTDASSVRRRGSSSTIASFYDKAKLPLSISQQTSNSAMAKGPPNKALEFLDMDSPRPAPLPPKMEGKKPARLDMTHLLPTSATSSRNPLARLARKRSMVLGPDMLTQYSPTMSTSSAISPSEAEPKPEKKPRRKLTRESLRSLRSLANRHSTISTEDPETSSLYKRTTDAGTLYQLYQHYENTSFRDTMTSDGAELEEEEEEDSPHGEPVPERESRAGSRMDSRHNLVSSATPIKTRYHVPSSSPMSRHHFSPNSTFDAIAEMPPSALNPALASPPNDYAGSVSSRHTRTSKASKWTDQSFTDFDPNATSVLSLSSDSEDEFSEPPRTAMSAPSIASLESASSPPDSRRPSNTSLSQESYCSAGNKSSNQLIGKRAGKCSGNQGLTTERLSFYVYNNIVCPVDISAFPSVHVNLRISRKSKLSSSSIGEIRHVAMLQSRAAPAMHRHHEPATVAGEPHISPKKHSSPRIGQLTPPISPSSMDLKDGPVLTLNGTGDIEDERFMAVTRQEELLLAAMRARRAIMREGNQIADIDGLDRVRVEDDRTASKKESLSSIKTVKVKNDKLQPPSVKPRPSEPRPSEPTAISSDQAITMLFPNPPTGRSSPTVRVKEAPVTDSGKQEEVPVCLDHDNSTVQPLEKAEPTSELSDFMRFESEQFPAPPVSKPSHNRASLAAPAKGGLARSASARKKSNPRRESDIMSMAARPSTVQGHHKSEVASRNASISDWRPAQVEPVIERPESSASSYESEPETQPPPRMKAVRISAVGISAVGTQLPEIGQWGDDG
ncbi:hypothetical protein VSDG_09731 [Cytospora chrysosperma]|uniref:Uncharacterized protein n=1 Tax=Cytospora chrysosperma TaxID=252740 RepID=A0A423V9X2_CYTCH|nr:hypothetical protein VSDG_09731 [Valsa sordida]